MANDDAAPRSTASPLGRKASRKARGRPWVLSVRADVATKLRIRRAAAREGLSPSEWVRLRLGEALDGAERDPAGPFAGNGIGGGPNSLRAVSAQNRTNAENGAAEAAP